MKITDLERFTVDPSSIQTPVWAEFWALSVQHPLVATHQKAFGKADLTACLGSENRRFSIWMLHDKVILLVNSTKGAVINCTPNVLQSDLEKTIRYYIKCMKEVLYEDSTHGTALPR